jgi:hypothetical protein
MPSYYHFYQNILSQFLGIYYLLINFNNLFNLLFFHSIGGVFLMVQTLCALSSKPYPPKQIDLVVYYNSINYPDELSPSDSPIFPMFPIKQ